MIKEAIGTGNTVDEAKAAAMLELGISDFDDFNVEVIQTPTKKILGLFGGNPAKVKVTTEVADPKPEKKQNKTNNKKNDKKPVKKVENKKEEKVAPKVETVETVKDVKPTVEVAEKPSVSKNGPISIESVGISQQGSVDSPPKVESVSTEEKVKKPASFGKLLKSVK